jgi:hypothetical protein
LPRIADKFRSEITEADRAAWTASSPVDWAKESFANATSESVEYCVMIEDGWCGYAVDRKEWERGSPKKKVHVGSEYIATQGETVRERIRRAGIRLAHLLNEAFK